MKVLRLDNQGAWDDMVFDNLGELRDYLCSLHADDCEEEDREALLKYTLDEILCYGAWSYRLITDKEAEEYEG